MKNLKGGYKIVSLQKNDIASSFTLTGLYDAIKDSYDKPILLTEIVVSTEEKNDVYTLVNKSGTSYVVEAYGYTLTVASNDAVTTAVKSNGVTSIGGKDGAITLGSGLSIDADGELSATGGGNTLYQHFIGLSKNTDGNRVYCGITLITSTSDLINTKEKISAIIGSDNYITASGSVYGDGGDKVGIISQFSMTSGIYLNFRIHGMTDTAGTLYTTSSGVTILDTVMQIQ